MSLLDLAAACTLQLAITTLSPAPTGWTETTEAELRADGGRCTWVEIALPPGAHLEGWRARIARHDGPRQKAGDHRAERIPRALDGRGALRLHTSDLRPGDRLQLRFTRRWTDDSPWIWRPAPAKHAELKAPASLSWEAQGDVRRPRANLAWIGEPGPEEGVILGADRPAAPPQPSAARPDPATLQPASEVAQRLRVELRVPPGDPQRRLFPGGGASTRTELQLRFLPSEADRGWTLPLPADRAELEWAARPAGNAQLIERDDSALLVIDASEGPTEVTVGWTQPDAPTFGERPAHLQSLDVRAPGGRVVWEGDQWLLAGIHDRPVLPSREALLRALDSRFRAASMPEPGLPNALRGLSASWEAASLMVDLLHDRALPGAWPADPLWPRRLIRARKSGTLSATEAALITWLYARQLGLDAQWVLVRPASAGPGAPTSPAGYTEALVRLEHAGEVRWLDPSCTQCGPFEVRPELWGASALAPGLQRTPGPLPGQWTVTLDAQGVQWDLEGAPALELRRWLAELPHAEHARALAARMAGPGATLAQAHALDQRGRPAHLVAHGGEGAQADPLQLPVPDAQGQVWIPWIGGRKLIQPATAHARPTRVEAGPLTYELQIQGTMQVETLEIRARLISTDDIQRIKAARAAAIEPEPPAEPESGPHTEPSEPPAP